MLWKCPLTSVRQDKGTNNVSTSPCHSNPHQFVSLLFAASIRADPRTTPQSPQLARVLAHSTPEPWLIFSGTAQGSNMKGSVKGLKGSVIGFILCPVADGLAVGGMPVCGEAATFRKSLACSCGVFVGRGLVCGSATRAPAIIEETQALKSKAPNKARKVIIRRKGLLFMVVAPFEFLERGCRSGLLYAGSHHLRSAVLRAACSS